MGALLPRTVFRYYEVDGVSSSGKHEPIKAEIIQLLEQLFGVSRGGWVVAGTLAELEAITPESETDGGVVLTGAGAGYYEREGGEWVFGRGWPDTFARVELSGGGTAQTGAVASGVVPANTEVFFAFVETPNTGPLTLSITGEPPREVVNLAGNPLAAGEWTGTVMFALRNGKYQLLLDAGAAASAAQSASEAEAERILAGQEADRSEDAAIRAETAAAGVEYPVSYGVGQSLSSLQQETARGNIGAASEEEVESLRGSARTGAALGTSPASVFKAKDVLAAARRSEGLAIDYLQDSAVIVDHTIAEVSGAVTTIGTFTAAGERGFFGSDRLLHTAAAGVPRFEHDPATGRPLGVGFNRAETPLISADVGGWTKTNVTVSASADETGIDGDTSAFAVIETTAAGAHSINKNASLTAGVSYVFSAYVRDYNDSNRQVRLTAFRSGGSTMVADFDPVTGKAVTVVGVEASSGPLLPNGFRRLEIRFTADATATWSMSINISNHSSYSYEGSTSAGIIVTQPRLDVGAARVPYPGSTVVADSHTVDVADFPFDSDTGSLVFRCRPAPYSGAAQTHVLFSLRNSSTNDHVRVQVGSNDGRIELVSSTGGITLRVAPNTNSGDIVVALVWRDGFMWFLVNGVCRGRIDNDLPAISPDKLHIGGDQSINRWDGIISSVLVTPTFLDFADLYDVDEMRLDCSALEVGLAPNREIYVQTAEGNFPLTNAMGDNFNLRRDDARRGWVWTNRLDGVSREEFFPWDFLSSGNMASHPQVRPIVERGQSRRVGVNSRPAFTTTPPDATRALSFSPGPRLTASGSPPEVSTHVDYVEMRDLIPLAERDVGTSGETSASGFARYWLDNFANSFETLVFMNTAVGSTSYEDSAKQTPMWANAARAMGRLTWIAWRSGALLYRGATLWDQGDGNAGDAVSVYKAKMEELRDDTNALWQGYRDFELSRRSWRHASHHLAVLCFDRYRYRTGGAA